MSTGGQPRKGSFDFLSVSVFRSKKKLQQKHGNNGSFISSQISTSSAANGEFEVTFLNTTERRNSMHSKGTNTTKGSRKKKKNRMKAQSKSNRVTDAKSHASSPPPGSPSLPKMSKRMSSFRGRFPSTMGTGNTYKNLSLKGFGRPIASKSSCSYFVRDPKVLSLLRHTQPLTCSMVAQVSKKYKGMKGHSRGKKLVDLNYGFVSFANVDTLKTDHPTDNFFMANLSQMICTENSKIVTLHAYPDMKCSNDKHGHPENCPLVKYSVKFKSVEEAMDFARSILIEADNFATVIDLGLGLLAEQKNKVEKIHIECLKRKRVDLYSISRSRSSKVLIHSLEGLATHLRDQGNIDEAALWQEMADTSKELGLAELRQKALNRQGTRDTTLTQSVDDSTTGDPNQPKIVILAKKGLAQLQEDYQRTNQEKNLEILEGKLSMLFSNSTSTSSTTTVTGGTSTNLTRDTNYTQNSTESDDLPQGKDKQIADLDPYFNSYYKHVFTTNQSKSHRYSKKRGRMTLSSSPQASRIISKTKNRKSKRRGSQTAPGQSSFAMSDTQFPDV